MASTASDDFEQARVSLLSGSELEWEQLVVASFDETFSEGLYAGTLRERLKAFIDERVKPACDAAGERGRQVWEALEDPETAHNIERFALVCGFIVAELTHQHWPAKEVAALAFLMMALLKRPRR